MKSLCVAFLAVTLVQGAQAVASCYKCREVEATHDCTEVTKCSADEKCFTDKFVSQEGHVFYNLDCKANRVCDLISHMPVGRRDLDKRLELHVCSRCCDGDFCNRDLCTDVTPPPGPRQMQCYQCTDLIRSSDCETLAACDFDEECFSSTYVNDNGETRTDLGCQRKLICDVLNQTMAAQGGRRVSGRKHICNACCNGDHCNLTPCDQIPGAAVQH